MTKVVVTAQVENVEAWEQAFRSHGELFRSQAQTAASPYIYGTMGENEVAVCADVTDIDTYMKLMESPEQIEAMKKDGVRQETVKVFVLDKEFNF
jgi:hypothetical protein